MLEFDEAFFSNLVGQLAEFALRFFVCGKLLVGIATARTCLSR